MEHIIDATTNGDENIDDIIGFVHAFEMGHFFGPQCIGIITV